mmetsp:Transcript_5520/g.21762  ORF Transcript_5520/g.21762 Transcript_5520/m.21762 type:complete len:364 (+) Transcript_5520:883-1974(+)
MRRAIAPCLSRAYSGLLAHRILGLGDLRRQLVQARVALGAAEGFLALFDYAAQLHAHRGEVLRSLGAAVADCGSALLGRRWLWRRLLRGVEADDGEVAARGRELLERIAIGAPLRAGLQRPQAAHGEFGSARVVAAGEAQARLQRPHRAHQPRRRGALVRVAAARERRAIRLVHFAPVGRRLGGVRECRLNISHQPPHLALRVRRQRLLGKGSLRRHADDVLASVSRVVGVDVGLFLPGCVEADVVERRHQGFLSSALARLAPGRLARGARRRLWTAGDGLGVAHHALHLGHACCQCANVDTRSLCKLHQPTSGVCCLSEAPHFGGHRRQVVPRVPTVLAHAYALGQRDVRRARALGLHVQCR